MFCWPVIFRHVAPFLEQDRKQLSVCRMRKSQNHREEMPESQDGLFQGLWFAECLEQWLYHDWHLSFIQAVSGCWVGIGWGNMDFFTHELHLSFHVWYYVCEFGMGVFFPCMCVRVPYVCPRKPEEDIKSPRTRCWDSVLWKTCRHFWLLSHLSSPLVIILTVVWSQVLPTNFLV